VTIQKELELEALLIEQLQTLGYERAQLRNETALLENLRQKIQQLNKIAKPFSNA
jgi:type I restriction enzyme R subunit